MKDFNDDTNSKNQYKQYSKLNFTYNIIHIVQHAGKITTFEEHPRHNELNHPFSYIWFILYFTITDFNVT